MPNKKKEQPEVVGFLGVGFDNKDEHKRITRNKSFILAVRRAHRLGKAFGLA